MNPVILSIESSGACCGAALSQGKEIVANYSHYGKYIHDKLLAELIKRILTDTEASVEGLDAVAVSSGPGSFTGLRIGASIAKGLCFENKPKLIAIPTLSALAFKASKEAKTLNIDEIISIVPAYKEYIYYQKFSSEGKERSEISHCSLSEFNRQQYNNVLIYGPVNTESLGKSVFSKYENLSPVIISALGFEKYMANDFVDSHEFVPLYVQEFEVKTKKKRK